MVDAAGFLYPIASRKGRPNGADKFYFPERREVAAAAVSRGELFLRPRPACPDSN